MAAATSYPTGRSATARTWFSSAQSAWNVVHAVIHGHNEENTDGGLSLTERCRNLAKTHVTKPGLTFLFWNKISVSSENGKPAEISWFSGNSDRKGISNLKFRNSGLPAEISVYYTGIPVHFTRNWWKWLENDGKIMYLWKKLKILAEFTLVMSILIDYNTQHIRNSSTQWEIKNETHYNNAKKYSVSKYARHSRKLIN